MMFINISAPTGQGKSKMVAFLRAALAKAGAKVSMPSPKAESTMLAGEEHDFFYKYEDDQDLSAFPHIILNEQQRNSFRLSDTQYLEVGQRWKHVNGHIYQVGAFAEHQNDAPVVVLVNVATGNLYTRSIRNFFDQHPSGVARFVPASNEDIQLQISSWRLE